MLQIVSTVSIEGTETSNSSKMMVFWGLQPCCSLDWFGFVRSSRNATPNSANIVYSSKAIRVHTVRATSCQTTCFWSTVHFICRPDVNLEVIPVWGPLVGLADHGRLITHELAVLSCVKSWQEAAESEETPQTLDIRRP